MRRSFIIMLGLLTTGFVFQGSASAAVTHKATAKLFGPTSLKGTARYEEKPKQGTTLRRFVVEVEKGIPLQTYSIQVNGVQTGSVSTNVLGFGEFELRTPQFIDSPGDGSPMPDAFPKLDTGDLVTVGPLSGTFFDKLQASVQKVKLRGDFAGAGAASGKARYEERFKNNGLMRRFTVEVEDAPAGTAFDIRVNNKLVGTLVMGNGPETEFELRTGAFIDSPSDGSPMPKSFPSLKVGDVVQVGSMTTTLQLTGGGGGGGGGNDDPPGHD